MSQLQAKQINKNLAGWVALTNQAASGNTLVVTSALTTALGTAGNGGTSVPLNANGSSSTEGVICGSTSNVPVFSYPSGVSLEVAGNQVYGVITYATSVYTVSFFSLVSGVATATSVTGAVNLFIPYSFSFNDYPFNAALTGAISDPGGPGTQTGTFYVDTGISVSSTNTISSLAKTPIIPSSVVLYVNGQALAAGTNFSVSGQTISISAGQITANGYNINTTDSVFAIYAY